MPLQAKGIGPYNLEYDSRLLANDLQHISNDKDMECISELLYNLGQEQVTVEIDCIGHTQQIYDCNHIIKIYDKRRVISIRPVPTATT